MAFTSRPYNGEDDFGRMIALVRDAWRNWEPYTHFHVGDLAWRMREPGYAEGLWLWEDAQGETAGFGEFHYGSTLEFQVHPRYVNILEPDIVAWLEKQSVLSERREGEPAVAITWANDGEAQLRALLVERGYEREEAHYCQHLRALDTPVEEALPPEGYRVRTLRGAEEIKARAAAHRGGWESTKMTAEIYTHLTRQPGYRPELDIVVEGPDGAFVACCNIWLDEENGAGEFEPVSVHPDHRRKGIGRAMILFGLRQMQRHGMRLAYVTSRHANLPARRLYETCGMPIARREYRYRKMLGSGHTWATPVAPREFQALIDDLRNRGFHANFRQWGMGDTIFVGHDRAMDISEIVAFRRALYVGRRETGAWYVWPRVDENDEFSEAEIGPYIERRLTASE